MSIVIEVMQEDYRFVSFMYQEQYYYSIPSPSIDNKSYLRSTDNVVFRIVKFRDTRIVFALRNRVNNLAVVSIQVHGIVNGFQQLCPYVVISFGRYASLSTKIVDGFYNVFIKTSKDYVIKTGINCVFIDEYKLMCKCLNTFLCCLMQNKYKDIVCLDVTKMIFDYAMFNARKYLYHLLRDDINYSNIQRSGHMLYAS